MRLYLTPLVLLLLPAASFSQTKEIQDGLEQNLATIRYVQSLQTPSGGFAASLPAGDVKPAQSLRATSAAVRSLKYLTGKPVKEAVPHADKVAAFVLSCYDAKTGGFADAPGGKPDVNITSIGIMAAVEFDIPKDKFRTAMDYLKANAKSFEEVRLGAAAVEAWGVKDCPFDLKPWFDVVYKQGNMPGGDDKDGGARETASCTATVLRLNRVLPAGASPLQILQNGQRDDGGWSNKGAKASDMGSTYRVMRAFMLLGKGKQNRGFWAPQDTKKLREFIAKCRNQDGGYGTAPGEKSSISGVYYAAIVTHWLDDMEKK